MISSNRGRKRGRERESALKDWSLTNSLGYFDVTLTWFPRMYVFLGIWEMKFENLFILDSITLCSREWTYWVCAVTFGWRSWCDCQRCEIRERWKIERVSERIRRREGETVRLTGECVLEEEWITDIFISFGMWNHWISDNGTCPHCLSSLLDGFVIFCIFFFFANYTSNFNIWMTMKDFILWNLLFFVCFSFLI